MTRLRLRLAAFLAVITAVGIGLAVTVDNNRLVELEVTWERQPGVSVVAHLSVGPAQADPVETSEVSGSIYRQFGAKPGDLAIIVARSTGGRVPLHCSIRVQNNAFTGGIIAEKDGVGTVQCEKTVP